MFHAVSAAWLLLLAIPVVVFYFLKLKRPRQDVPSLVLWRQVMADQRVNAPFQRFKRNLLLWLQLLALAALVLACMQPFSSGGGDRADRLPIIIDVSASMAARGAAGMPTRLELAKKHVRSLIDGLGRDQQICLVAMGQDARRLTGFSDDRRELASALDRLAVEDVAANPAAALHLVQALGRSHGFDRALLVSDGNLPDHVDADLAFHLDFHLIAGGGANLGITALGAQRRSDGRWDVFAAIDGAVEADAGASVELLQDGMPLTAKAVAPGALGSERLAFRVDGSAPVEIEVRLRPDGFDALAGDDRAFLALPAIRPVRVAVAPALTAWRRALSTQPGVELVAGAGAVDIVVSDQVADLVRPALVRLTTGLLPPELSGDLTIAEDGGSAVVDWRRSDPLLAHVALDDLLIAQRVAWRGAGSSGGERTLDAKGFTVLVHGSHGPLLVQRARPGGIDYHVLFRSERSTLPFRLGFPVLAGNLVVQAQRLAGTHESDTRRTGMLSGIAATPGAAVAVRCPDGATLSTRADPSGVIAGLAAPQAGFYRLRDGEREWAIGVSLADARETRLVAVDKLQVREVAVATGGQSAPAERVWWPWLLTAALIIGLAEWWFANRRPG